MSYTDEISPRKFQLTVQRGFKRLDAFRAARVHFIQEYCGSYYDKTEGEVGTAPINLIFNAIRVLIPTMVMSFPKHTVMTPYLQAREYANLLGLALDNHDMQIDIRNTYRSVIVDALFTLGVLKTGLTTSGSVAVFDDDKGQESLDPGTVYTEKVDFDNFIIDPNCRDHMFRDAAFIGDKIRVPRRTLLETGLYDEDLVNRLPICSDERRKRQAFDLSMRQINVEDNYDLEDEVEIAEIWVPSANAIVTVPGSDDVLFDDYLRVDDYYGVKEGPYTLLSLTPPVPGNPLPIPTVGIWYDLHVLANRMAKKIVEQAERQKDIMGYKASSADDATELRDAGDGEAVKVDDPDGVQVYHFGGQQNSNERNLAQLQDWFNQMAANPDQIGGQRIEGKSATAVNVLQQNASIGLEDMKDLVYQLAAGEARKRAWYFHTDPLMKIPLTRRQMAPGGPSTGPTGEPFLQPPTMQDVQVILTPEARRGDFLDFTFNIEPESMGRRDSKTRLQQAMAFAQQILPAVASAAQIFGSMGIPFDPIAFLVRMAHDAGIEWMDEVLLAPQVQQTAMQRMAMGPQPGPSKGQIAGQPNPGLSPAIAQNGQPGNVQGAPPTPGLQQRQDAQAGANDAQTAIKLAIRHAFTPSTAKPPLANATAGV
jgi:hypothetical protein